MAVRIQIRRDIAANWVTANPVLFQGEIGYELDTRKMKIGDGATDWNSLAYNFTDSTGIDLLQVIEGNGAYYFKSTASDLGAGRYEMTKDIPAGGGFGISNSGVADGDILAEFASVDGFPNVTYLPSGPLTFYMNAVQTGGTKLTKLYAEFYTRTIAGVNTLIATSDFTDGLTGVATLFSSFVNMPVTRNIGLTDRLLIVIKANVTGAGTDPDITINIQGATSSRCRFPFESVTSVNGFFGDVT
ncbi:hypothetical protein KDA08_05685, partial [Candidatus Saccharibacteria bacterium]|nr:hypothetical protein [Candidatus Saccharibacteria bacterium]